MRSSGAGSGADRETLLAKPGKAIRRRKESSQDARRASAGLNGL
jgi:hypothetical protein